MLYCFKPKEMKLYLTIHTHIESQICQTWKNTTLSNDSVVVIQSKYYTVYIFNLIFTKSMIMKDNIHKQNHRGPQPSHSS